jgi:hypothetical protein
LGHRSRGRSERKPEAANEEKAPTMEDHGGYRNHRMMFSMAIRDARVLLSA